jgi:hypothetical protein
MRVSPDVHAPYLFVELPVRDANGMPRDQLSLTELADLRTWAGASRTWMVRRSRRPWP